MEASKQITAHSTGKYDRLDDTTKKLYLANQGDIVCVCNMETAMLDLPVPSPKAFEDRAYDADTEKIPPIGTDVEIILEVMPEKKK